MTAPWTGWLAGWLTVLVSVNQSNASPSTPACLTPVRWLRNARARHDPCRRFHASQSETGCLPSHLSLLSLLKSPPGARPSSASCTRAPLREAIRRLPSNLPGAAPLPLLPARQTGARCHANVTSIYHLLVAAKVVTSRHKSSQVVTSGAM
jgi:hypothetical protein